MTSDAVELTGERIWRGYEPLVDLLVPVESIEPHPRNPRRGNLDVIARSLAAFGQTKPIVVWAEKGWIVAGNHTRRAAMEKLGWTHIAAVHVSMTEERATEYLLADNRTSDLGEYDRGQLVELLEEVADRGQLDVTGYTADDYDDLIASAASSAEDEFRSGMQEDDEVPVGGERRIGTGDVREMVLLYGVADAEQIGRWLKMLQREWKIDGANAAVFQAVKSAAETL